MEPLLYAFQPPRTIADTLSEYEFHLQEERGLSRRRVSATLRTLKRFLDPIEAPLVSLTPELARTLVREEEARPEEVDLDLAMTLEDIPPRRLPLVRARRFFRWAAQRGYVYSNPFEEVTIPAAQPETQADWVA